MNTRRAVLRGPVDILVTESDVPVFLESRYIDMSNFITSSERTQLNFGNASYWIGTLADLECVWNPKKAANEGDAEAVRKTLLPLLHKSLTLPVEAPWAFWLWEIVSCMTMLEACFNRKGKEVEIARSCLGVSQNEIILRMADLFEQDFISQVECARLILEKAEAHVRAYMESRDIPKMCRSRCSGFTSDGSSASANALPSAEESLSLIHI